MYNYRPLPEKLTISPSIIDGLGLFATQKIVANTDLGIGWIRNKKFENGWIRTPIGGFINHSEFPNCIIQRYKSHDTLSLITIKDIEIYEELTTDYDNFNFACIPKDENNKIIFKKEYQKVYK